MDYRIERWDEDKQKWHFVQDFTEEDSVTRAYDSVKVRYPERIYRVISVIAEDKFCV